VIVRAQPPATATWAPHIRSAYRFAKCLARPLFRYGLPDRDELPTYLNQLGLVGRGAEVGVQRGLYSETLLRRWRGEELISIDPWAAQDSSYADPANVSQGDHDALYAETCERLAPFGLRSHIERATGDEVARFLPDESLDFVYLDARHDLESVLSDLQTWWPKVRWGGLISGHDYLDALVLFDGHEGLFSVRSAVLQFFGHEVQTTIFDRPWRSWWTRKTKRPRGFLSPRTIR
jgi:Methyltransferase domain